MVTSLSLSPRMFDWTQFQVQVVLESSSNSKKGTQRDRIQVQGWVPLFLQLDSVTPLSKREWLN